MAGRRSEAPARADVLVIGGGPAGTAAAITAARLGLSVTLVEASRDPREQPGETVHPGIETVLEYLGVLDPFLRAGFERYESIELDRAGIVSTQRLGGDARGPWKGWQLRRATFDEMLRRRAADVGVEVLLGARALHVLREERRVAGAVLDCGERRARLVIDASGHHGWLAQRLGLVSRFYSEPIFAGFGHVEEPADAATTAPAFRAERDGWTWEASVRSGVRAWVRLARTAAEARRAPDSMATATRIARPAARDVTWRLVGSAAGAGYLIAGDAAARLDPASGQGILRALVAGVQAARTAHRVLRRPADTAWAMVEWDRWVVDTFEAQAARLARSYADLGIDLRVTATCGLSDPQLALS